MEEKKIDVNSIIGFVLIFGILIFMFYQNRPTPEELAEKEAKQEQLAKEAKEETATVVAQPNENTPAPIDVNDSLAVANYQSQIGAFGFTQPRNGSTVLENELLFLRISHQGGQVIEAKMKNFVTYDSVPVYLVKDGNSSFGIDFSTTDNRVLNTKDLFFIPSIRSENGNQILSLKAKTADNSYLEYRYEMRPDDYLVDFTIRSQGLEQVLSDNKPMVLVGNLKAYVIAKV